MYGLFTAQDELYIKIKLEISFAIHFVFNQTFIYWTFTKYTLCYGYKSECENVSAFKKFSLLRYVCPLLFCKFLSFTGMCLKNSNGNKLCFRKYCLLVYQEMKYFRTLDILLYRALTFLFRPQYQSIVWQRVTVVTDTGSVSQMLLLPFINSFFSLCFTFPILLLSKSCCYYFLQNTLVFCILPFGMLPFLTGLCHCYPNHINNGSSSAHQTFLQCTSTN